MKLSSKYIVHNTGRDVLLVPTADAAFSGVVKGNETLGTILSLLSEDRSEIDLLHAMAAEYDASEEQLSRDLQKALGELRKIGALDE